MQFIQNFIQKLYTWYGKRNVVIVFSLIVALLLLGTIINFFSSDTAEQTTTNTASLVVLKSVSELQNSGPSLSVLGTVEATNEARLETEAGGRVTAVYADLGDTVRAGAVLATIENGREQAVVLQAQGSYEAALAGASQSDVSVDAAKRALQEAQIAAKNTYRSAFTTSDDTIRNFTDELFSNVDTPNPGLKLDGAGQAPALSKERGELGTMLEQWRTKVNTLNSISDEETLLTEAETNTRRVGTFVTTLSTLLAEEDVGTRFTESEIAVLKNRFSGARAQLDGALGALSATRNALNASASGLKQAEIAATNGGVSLSDAQVKQALGALRLAQANLEKTIVRTPITGTVNALSLKAGTFVGQSAPAAVISSEGALEVVAYVNESDARNITPGDEVTIGENTKGVVTEIASALDTVTKKIELRVGISDDQSELVNGQAVTVFLKQSTESGVTSDVTRLPISAIKMTPDGSIVFTVNSEMKLVAHAVTLGAIAGDTVVVLSGTTADMRIVTDARGLKAGETVEVK